MKKNEFENNFCLALVEEILYLRDRNPKKNWGHIWGLTTVFSYSRWNRLILDFMIPNILMNKIIPGFKSVHFNFIEGEFSHEQIYFIEKYNIFSGNINIHISREDINIFPKISKIINWHNSNYIRSSLGDVSKGFFSNDFLINFLFGISKNETNEYDYYFCFSESIDGIGMRFLMNSWKINQNFLFSNIALASYFHQHKKVDISCKYYSKALDIDSNNPWVTGKYAYLLTFRGDIYDIQIAEKMMKKVIDLIPDIPWAYDWYGEMLFRNGKYSEALKIFEDYEKITEGKYRTFEPYMKRAQIYLALGDFLAARDDILKENEYYFGEGYRERLNIVKDEILTAERNLNLL